MKEKFTVASEVGPNNESELDIPFLIENLTRISKESFPDGEDPVMKKLIDCLKLGYVEAAKNYVDNASDKFREYGEGSLVFIINHLYLGGGSPWLSLERRLAERKDSE